MRGRLLASLPWYDLREVRSATDALWRRVARHLREAEAIGAPEHLDRRTSHHRQWRSPDLLLSQACGYDVLLACPDHLQVVATPCYTEIGCDGPRHRSFVVVPERAPFRRLEDLRGTRCVINTRTSHSGMNVLRALVAPLHVAGRFFSDVRRSGSHRRSLRALRHGAADVAAVDCVTWGLLARHRPEALRGVRVLTTTAPVPAPPFVTRRAAPPAQVAALRRALGQAFADPALAGGREALGLGGVVPLDLTAYDDIRAAEAVARRHAYAEIDPARTIPRLAS